MTAIIKTIYQGRIEAGWAMVIHGETYDRQRILDHAGPGWSIPLQWENKIEGVNFKNANPRLNMSNQLVWLLIKRDE